MLWFKKISQKLDALGIRYALSLHASMQHTLIEKVNHYIFPFKKISCNKTRVY